MSICEESGGLDFKGLFTPATSGWNFVVLLEATSFDKAMEAYKAYVKKYGPHPQLPLDKVELLYTPKESGME